MKDLKIPFKLEGITRIDDTPVHKALMKMFNLIGIGERAGSGVPDIYSVWEQQLEKIAECMEPDREYRIAEIAEFLGVKETRTRELVRELIQLKKIEASGKNKGRRYRKIV